MRKLAELAMKGPKQALFLAVLFACIPMVSWLSAAIVSLVILRRGVDHGLKVLMWALLPAIVWAAFGQFSVVIGLIATTLLACVLRQTVSWQSTLLAVVPTGAIIAFGMYQFAPQTIEFMSNAVIGLLEGSLPKAGNETLVNRLESIRPIMEYGVAGAMAWVHSSFSVLSLMLARSWQSGLYNPGGFGDEFRQIRLTAGVAITLLALTVMGSAISPILTVLLPIASLPLFFSGMAMMHGLVKIGRMSSFWLIGIYVLLITLTQLAYPVMVLIACLDSLFDFRKRASIKAES